LVPVKFFWPGLGWVKFFEARVGSGQPSIVWVWKISPKNVKFFNFFGVKKMSSGWVKKCPCQRGVGLLFTAGQKYAMFYTFFYVPTGKMTVFGVISSPYKSYNLTIYCILRIDILPFVYCILHDIFNNVSNFCSKPCDTFLIEVFNH